MADSLIGATLGDYRVESALGRGGMGVVYLGEDLALGRKVAVKVLAPHLVDDADSRRRFQEEIRRSARIEHPHIIPVYQAGYEQGHFFIVMRYVDGRDLLGLITRDGPFSEPRALRLAGQLAAALGAVHEAGFAHRDVKPQNVLVWNGSHPDEHAFLTDFGIAKALNETTGMTGMGILGTPGYMAPELWLGNAVTPLSDQYALACVLFEMLAARTPFAGHEDIRAAHVDATPPNLDSVGVTVSEAVQTAINRGLSKDPQARFADVHALASALGFSSAAALRQSQQVTRVLVGARGYDDAVTALLQDAGYSRRRADLVLVPDSAEALRQRRRETRRELMGDPPDQGR